MSSRSYRLTPGEPVPDEVRRVAHGRIDHAIDELRGNSESSRAEAVHEARKDMKKLRALLRLVRGEIGDEVYAEENARFRDTARQLSGVRDADVMILTLADLEKRYGELPGAARKLRPALVAHRFRISAGSTRPAVQTAIDTLIEARERVDDWPLESDGFEAFEEGLGSRLPPGPQGVPPRPGAPERRAHARVAQAGEGPLVPRVAARGGLEARHERALGRGARAVGPARRRARRIGADRVGPRVRERPQTARTRRCGASR